jgi:hypothetical protein
MYVSRSQELATVKDSPLKPWQWKFRILVGRYLERLLRLLPREFEKTLRRRLRIIAKLFFGD